MHSDLTVTYNQNSPILGLGLMCLSIIRIEKGFLVSRNAQHLTELHIIQQLWLSSMHKCIFHSS